MMHDAFRPFRKRWRFTAELTGACTVYAWALHTDQLVESSLRVEQWPELPLRAGRFEVECNGPDDLRLVAMARIDEKEEGFEARTMIGFTREPIEG